MKIEDKVDRVIYPENKRRRRGLRVGKKTVVGILVVFITATLIVSGTLLTYFNKVETTIDVTQSVQMDGKDWNEVITHSIPDAIGGCCYCFEHTITNNGCEGIDLGFIEWGDPNLDGIEVNYYEPEPTCCNHILETLEVRVLDGQALDDDFEVYVDSTLVYTYDAVGTGAETWINHVIPLTTFQLTCCDSHTVEIKCTAAQAWSGHSIYGQLAVDTILLYCENQVLCDSVDIGNPTSEAGHQVNILPDWSLIEPLTSGGGYGGITDCRTTWEPGSDGTCRGATCVLTCEDCYEPSGCPECGSGTPIDFPIHLEQDETIDVCICYDLDMLIQPGQYIVNHQLVPV